MNVGIGTEAAPLPEKEYIMEIPFAVYEDSFIRYCEGIKVTTSLTQPSHFSLLVQLRSR
jgi:hypothetical protein